MSFNNEGSGPAELQSLHPIPLTCQERSWQA